MSERLSRTRQTSRLKRSSDWSKNSKSKKRLRKRPRPSNKSSSRSSRRWKRRCLLVAKPWKLQRPSKKNWKRRVSSLLRSSSSRPSFRWSCRKKRRKPARCRRLSSLFKKSLTSSQTSWTSFGSSSRGQTVSWLESMKTLIARETTCTIPFTS